MISKYDILYLAKKEYEEAREKVSGFKTPSLKECENFLLVSKRLGDVVLYCEGKLKFKGER